MIEIEGYAVVSENDCIADAAGKMPASLHSEAEWAFFQAGLDACEVVVLGRKSHEVTPNPKNRRRLVMTRNVKTIQQENETLMFWNPEYEGLKTALSAWPITVRRLGVTGGQGVFDHFLTGPCPYTCFYLSRMKGVHLSNGQKVFSEIETNGYSASQYLVATGYFPRRGKILDARASLVAWSH